MNKLLRVSGVLLALSLLLCPFTVAADEETPIMDEEMPFMDEDFARFMWGLGRCDVSVVIYGGWDGIPVRAWAGGVEMETQYTAQDAHGEAAVHWTFFPMFELYEVAIAPDTPPGLDPERWQYKLVRVEAPSVGLVLEEPEGGFLPVYWGAQYLCFFQLIDTYALAEMEPMQMMEPMQPVEG